MRAGRSRREEICKSSDQSRPPGDLHRRFRAAGNSDDEQRSAFGFVLAGDLAAVILDHSVDSAQAEAGAFADGLGGVEGIEHALGLANAGAGVGELQHDLVAP